MLQVVTHNGRPPGTGPGQGGKRLGYLFTNADGSTGAYPPSLLSLLPPPAAQPSSVKLPMIGGSKMAPITRSRDVVYGDVNCSCGEYTKVGKMQTQVACQSCGRTINVE